MYLNATGETRRAQSLPILIWRAEAAQRVLANFGYLSAPITFDDLGIEQLDIHRPGVSVLTDGVDPHAEVRGQGIEV